MMNNNNIKNVNQNENKTLMDAPVPSPVKDTAAEPTATSETAVTTAEAVTTTTTAAIAAEGSLANGSAGKAAAAVVTQSVNGSITHSQQKPPSVTGTVKPPSLSQGGKPPSVTQGSQKPPSLSQGQKPPSVPGSFTNQQAPQSQPFQPTLPQLPEPLIPLSHPIDTKQEIVENYLNSLPPVSQGGINLSNGSRFVQL